MSQYSLCSQIGENTGAIDCDKKPGVPSKFFVGSTKITPSQYASNPLLKTAFLGAINLPRGSQGKLFPFPEIQGTTPTKEANTEGNLGYGLKFVLREGRPSWNFTIVCGDAQYKALRSFNNSTQPVIFIDQDNVLWGIKDARQNFTGFSAQIFVSGNDFEDGNDVNLKTATVSISLVSASQWNDGRVNESVDFSGADFEGLKDVKIEVVGAVAASTKVKLTIPTGSLTKEINLYDYYPAAPASIFVATGNGAALPITGITPNASDKTYTLAFDTTAFNALTPGQEITINLVAPADLLIAGIAGSEGIKLVTSKP